MKRDLIQRINDLGPDGEELIDLMVTRIEAAKDEYGPLVIRDEGDYTAEGFQEVIDLPLWMGMRWIQRQRGLERNNGKT